MVEWLKTPVQTPKNVSNMMERKRVVRIRRYNPILASSNLATQSNKQLQDICG